jgi:amino acid adenylation domain-containing protein
VTSLSRVLFDKTKDYDSLDALSVSGRTITYQELKENALYVASALIQLGANNEAIGIVGQRKASSYFGVVGILFAGCYYTPINPKYSEKRILSILRDAKIRFLVGDKADLEMLEKVISLEGLSSIEAIVLPEGQSPTEKKWLDEKSIKSLTPLDKPKSMGLDDLAYLLYTSGSTGIPKGVQVANSNVLAFLRNMSSIYKLDPGFRASQTFDFSFDPSVSDMFFTWTNGGVLCVLPEEEILLPTEFIQRENITFWNSVPSIAGFMIKMGHLVPGCFPTLTNSMFCGEQFPKYIADAWQIAAPNSTVENLYGPTEATIYISRYVYTTKDKDQQFRNSIIPIGRSFVGHEFAVIDESGKKINNSEVGEIIYKGPQVTKGYLNDSSRTDSVFVTFDWDPESEKWYKSGDLGFFNEIGDLECVGRKDSQIKLGGRRIEIGEIESVLSVFPLTQDAVVVPIRDANQIVVGCVAFTMNKISNQDFENIRKQSEKQIEKIFFPKKIFTIETFPLTQSGKKDRKALAEQAAKLMTPGTQF